jgi:beta-glucosidase
MLKLTFLLAASLLCGGVAAAEVAAPAYLNRELPVEARVEDMLTRLTLEEKVALCHGNFTSGGVPRLGIGPLLMLDGRQGLRPVDDQKGTRTTSLPCALALSCTWDDDAARRFGGVLAEEMLAFRRHVLLAPMLNLVRSPLGGRNFENFGEDPYVVGRIGSAYIDGVQELGVGACACLLVANDCEFRRHFTSSNMDDRTLRELHLRGYEASVRDGKVWSMMTGNNLLNGTYCAQNGHLVQELMKNEIGFDGVMITDWRAAYDTVPTALAGTDMTTGHCSYVFGNGNLLSAVKRGDVPMDLLNEKARRVLRLYFRTGVIDPETRRAGSLDTPAHRQAARELAAAGMVLLTNEGGVLPLDSRTSRILVTGPAADVVLQGGGSGSVPAAVNITPFDGLKASLSGQADITLLPYPVNLQKAVQKGAVEWDESSTSGPKKRRKAGMPADIPSDNVLSEAAANADVVIFMAAGWLASEGRDLLDMQLPGKQAEAIAALARANKNVVVVLQANGAVSLDGWGDKAAAILAIHYSGQATGQALADVLTGTVNPSGKLTYTFAKKLEDYACHALNEWPAKLRLKADPVDPGMKPEDRKATHAFDTDYEEGVFAGHRWFDKKNIEPAYPFGFGLSYTSFTLSAIKAEPEEGGWMVSCNVKNTGSRRGAQVVQLYVQPPEGPVERPRLELKGYARLELDPGQTGVAKIRLSNEALRYFDPAAKAWQAAPGKYKLHVGTSSRDIPLQEEIAVGEK